MAGVGLFLLLIAGQALKATGFSFLTTAAWQPDVHRFGIAAVLTGTLLIAAVAGDALRAAGRGDRAVDLLMWPRASCAAPW